MTVFILVIIIILRLADFLLHILIKNNTIFYVIQLADNNILIVVYKSSYSQRGILSTKQHN